MQRNKYRLLLLLLVLMSASCLRIYDPVIETVDANKLVVSGLITDRGGPQVISVSRVSTINLPEAIPVKGCSVTISDNMNHQFKAIEGNNGNYNVLIDPVFLIPGNFFKTEILTPEGDSIVSDYDQYSSGPELNSVYFKRKDIAQDDPGEVLKGIQFCIDLNGDVSDSRFYRFETTETWEYHSQYPRELYFAGSVQNTYPPDYSMSVCWSTFATRNIHILSTELMVGNKYYQFPLHFVSNRTQKLMYGYSLLVNQYSLSKAAYKYWDQLRINTNAEGGLYEKQPLSAKGNLRNISHPEQKVLGFFGVSSFKTKRIFVSHVENLIMEVDPTCSYSYIALKDLVKTNAGTWPLYLLENTDANIQAPYILLGSGCVDCRKLGGTTVKPVFWPN